MVNRKRFIFKIGTKFVVMKDGLFHNDYEIMQ